MWNTFWCQRLGLSGTQLLRSQRGSPSHWVESVSNIGCKCDLSVSLANISFCVTSGWWLCCPSSYLTLLGVIKSSTRRQRLQHACTRIDETIWKKSASWTNCKLFHCAAKLLYFCGTVYNEFSSLYINVQPSCQVCSLFHAFNCCFLAPLRFPNSWTSELTIRWLETLR